MTRSKSGFPPIQQRLIEFIHRELSSSGNHYNVSKLIGDASTRQYFRCSVSEQSYIIAVYPKPFNPEKFSYLEVYELLHQIGLPVPEILAVDGDLGAVLQEDLGNESLQKRLLTSGKNERDNLLHQSIDHIVTLQQQGPKALEKESQASQLAFDEKKLNWELHFFRRHYLEGYRKGKPANQEELTEEFARLAADLANLPRFLCHRDYHVRNLFLKEDRVYIIDFQDTRWGPLCYDLVSLLKDSIQLNSSEIEEYKSYFLSKSRYGKPVYDFDRQFHLMCIQRLLKAIGTYGYQITQRNLSIYEQYLKSSLHRCFTSLQVITEFPYIRSVVENELNS